MADGRLLSGLDLEDTMLLNCIDNADVYKSMVAFYDDNDAIVFGCIGLKVLLETKMKADAIGLFMFGEVCPLPLGGKYGNLLFKIRFNRL